MRHTSKGRKEGIRLVTRIRTRQKFGMSMAMVGACGVTALVVLAFVFNFAGIRYSKAEAIDIREVKDQIFTTEKSLPAPILTQQEKAGPQTILIKRKNRTTTSEVGHE